MGEVFLVKENSTGQEYVMKKISMECLSEEEKTRALTEIEILKKHGNHPNIIRYQESFLGIGLLQKFDIFLKKSKK